MLVIFLNAKTDETSHHRDKAMNNLQLKTTQATSQSL